MKRRDFIALAGAAAATPWLGARAQQAGKARHVAVLMGGMDPGDAGGLAEAAAFEDGLKELGWKPGFNVTLDYRWPGAGPNQLSIAANAIAAAHPDLVVSRSTPATTAMMNRGLPLLFVVVADPIGSGFVKNLGQPAGEVTGFSSIEASAGGKWLELLKEAAPAVKRISILFNPATAPFAEGYVRSATTAAQTLGASVVSAPCGSISDVEAAFAVRAREGDGGVIVIVDTSLTEHRDEIVALASRYRVPAIYGTRIYVPAGGLMSYAADYPDILRRSASYVDRILHGAKPGDLPVQEPAKFTLSINLKAADAIGVILPQTLIARADEVIE